MRAHPDKPAAVFRLAAGVMFLLIAGACRPADPEALIAQGMRAYADGQPGPASRCWARALRAQPDRNDVRMALGAAYWQAGRRGRALQTLTLATEHADASAAAWRWLGYVLAQERRWDEARTAYQQAVARSIAPSATLLSDLGALEALSGQTDAAHARLRQALALDPQHRPALLNLGILQHDSLGQPDLAVETFRRFLSLTAPDDPLADKVAAYWPAARASAPAAPTTASPPRSPAVVAPQASPGPSAGKTRAAAHFREGLAHQKAGRAESALKAYGEALKLDAGLYPAAFNSGLVLRGLGRQAAAREMFVQALKLNPALHEGRYMLAVTLHETGRDAEAARELDRLLAARPEDARARDLRRRLPPGTHP